MLDFQTILEEIEVEIQPYFTAVRLKRLVRLS